MNAVSYTHLDVYKRQIFNDGNGNWYYSSQARLPKSVDNAIMLGHVRNIRWTKDGWPLVMARRRDATGQKFLFCRLLKHLHRRNSAMTFWNVLSVRRLF